MGTIATDERKTTLFYNSENSLGKQTYSYVYGLDENLQAIDLSKTKVTGTQWATIAEGLEMPISNLINTKHPDFNSEYDNTATLSDNDWIKVLNTKPKCLKAPILIFQNTYYLINTPSEVENIIKGKSEAFDARNSD
ncbi:arsenate reductase family protein [Lacinutrix sp. Hel_I_90]|uniref:arsenate reductase family protein n=1 Tax=Lacinutrix sp. Hel_I_90 TaxID=1249999 RepID=UPI0005C9D2B8|nr:arsenate reductase [Lacinutrix sp. Hel_I_90]